MTATFVDGRTNQMVERALTDAEIIETFLPQVELSASKQTVTADGTDFVTVTAQLKSAPLNDGSRVNHLLVHKIMLMMGETVFELETDTSGQARCELDFADNGVYQLQVQNLHSNILEITAV